MSDEYLPALPASATHLAGREQRMLRLALPALREAARHCAHPLPLFLGLPEEAELPEGRGLPPFVEVLARNSGGVLQLERTRCFREGRASGLLALHEALRLLQEGRVSEVLVGGVDTLLDLMVLANLEGESRLRTYGPSDGLTPGEGAAFLWLGRRRARRDPPLSPLAWLQGTATGRELGHRYSPEPYRGDGLAETFQGLFAGLSPSHHPVRCVYAGFNGESFWGKEWGVAFLRSRARFAEPLRLEHPAENVGDPGAAHGPLMVGLAAVGLQKGYREGPVLVWCSSDREARGAALLHRDFVEG